MHFPPQFKLIRPLLQLLDGNNLPRTVDSNSFKNVTPFIWAFYANRTRGVWIFFSSKVIASAGPGLS